MLHKPFAPACERNREPILAVLRAVFSTPARVLEIGSGTGQHAVYFAAALPHLHWQTSDLPGQLPGIRAWLAEAEHLQLPAPLALDVTATDWPVTGLDGVFSANTAHILRWPQVEAMFQGVARVLAPGGRFCLYGPFKIHGHHTSPGNTRFDTELRCQDPSRGIRDLADLDRLADSVGLHREADHPLPANNRLLIWRRSDGQNHPQGEQDATTR